MGHWWNDKWQGKTEVQRFLTEWRQGGGGSMMMVCWAKPLSKNSYGENSFMNVNAYGPFLPKT
jgi:hypothetical protein